MDVPHRDWFAEGANVFVELYTDRIEVISPGGLPKGMTLADLGRKSVRRNALIADLLHRIGFIEKAGTGTLMMIRESLTYNISPGKVSVWVKRGRAVKPSLAGCELKVNV